MNRFNVLLGGLAVGILFSLTACASSTQLTTVWSDPTIRSQELHRIMVIDVAKNPTIRRAFEERFAAALAARKVDAQPSYRLVSDASLDSAQVNMEIHKGHCDGVLVTRVVDERTVKTYYPPTSSVHQVPRPYYGGWYNYYALGVAHVMTPGYTLENQFVNMETNLYRVSDGALVWSALSRTWLEQSETPGDEIDPIVNQLVHGLTSASVVWRRRK